MSRQQLIGILRLGSIASVMAVIWLQVLPWVAARPKMAARLEQLDKQGIDPSAMFYTDLEAMEPILKRLERRSSN